MENQTKIKAQPKFESRTKSENQKNNLTESSQPNSRRSRRKNKSCSEVNVLGEPSTLKKKKRRKKKHFIRSKRYKNHSYDGRLTQDEFKKISKGLNCLTPATENQKNLMLRCNIKFSNRIKIIEAAVKIYIYNKLKKEKHKEHRDSGFLSKSKLYQSNKAKKPNLGILKLRPVGEKPKTILRKKVNLSIDTAAHGN